MIPRVKPEGMLFGKPLRTFPDHALFGSALVMFDVMLLEKDGGGHELSFATENMRWSDPAWCGYLGVPPNIDGVSADRRGASRRKTLPDA
jgi:hypothetical protein